MYLICDKCGYTIDAKPYHVGTICPKCDGKMREMTEEDEKQGSEARRIARNV